ncbi:MAG: hypothetical protein GF307_13600 [candidate division Zixibacteria bacterium]|nr:hypothetical protein [candidate division Zixibacteria bacterium]
MNLFARHIKRGLFLGGLSGWAFAVWIIDYTGYFRFYVDSLILIIYSITGFCLAGIFISGFYATIEPVLCGRNLHNGSLCRRLVISLEIASLISLFIVPFALSRLKVQFFFSYQGLAWIIGIFVITFLLALALNKLMKDLSSMAGIPAMLILVVVTVLYPLIRNFAYESGRKEPPETIQVNENGKKIFVFGVDAAEWSIMGPLIEKGKLPHFEKVINKGASAELEIDVSGLLPFTNTFVSGILTPSVWETIATGQPETEHGIISFARYKLPLLEHRIFLPQLFVSALHDQGSLSRFDSRCFRVWELCDRYGISTLVSGWPNTYPAINMHSGFIVSNNPGADVENRISPDSIQHIIPQGAYISENEYLDNFPDLKQAFSIGINGEVSILDRFRSYGATLKNMLHSFSIDKYYFLAGMELYKRYRPEFSAIYLLGIDHIQHFFMKYQQPESFSKVDSLALKAFDDFIPQYYCKVDSMLGEILDAMDDSTVLMIISDHGQSPRSELNNSFLNLDELRNPGSYDYISGGHNKTAVLILYGDGINPGHTINDADIYDVYPTILAIMGMPIPGDIRGRVLDEAINIRQWPGFRIDSIESYGTKEYHYVEFGDEGINETLKRQLKALGYIK